MPNDAFRHVPSKAGLPDGGARISAVFDHFPSRGLQSIFGIFSDATGGGGNRKHADWGKDQPAQFNYGPDEVFAAGKPANCGAIFSKARSG